MCTQVTICAVSFLILEQPYSSHKACKLWLHLLTSIQSPFYFSQNFFSKTTKNTFLMTLISECGSSDTAYTEGDLSLTYLEVHDGYVTFTTPNSKMQYTDLDLLPPYKVVKCQTGHTSPELIAEAKCSVGEIFDSLIEGKFKATGGKTCWNNTGLCDTVKGCNAGDGVLVFQTQCVSLKGRIHGMDPDVPNAIVVTSDDGDNYITLSANTLYIIHGTNNGFHLQYRKSTKDIMETFGFDRMLCRPLPGSATRSDWRCKSGKENGMVFPTESKPTGSYSFSDYRGRRSTFWFNDHVLENCKTVCVAERQKRARVSMVDFSYLPLTEEVVPWSLLEKKGINLEVCYLDRRLWQIRFSYYGCLLSGNTGRALSKGVKVTREDIGRSFFTTETGQTLFAHTGQIGNFKVGHPSHFQAGLENGLNVYSMVEQYVAANQQEN